MSTAPRWRLQTEHVSAFKYSTFARASYNEVRKLPPTTAQQTSLDARVQTTPSAVQYSYTDYWGTKVVAFNVDAPHEHLTVRSLSNVETRPAGDIVHATWDDLEAITIRHEEYLSPSRYAWLDDELRSVGQDLRRDTPSDTVQAVVGWVQSSLKYVRGITHVHSSATEAYAARSGVCQDFAHLTLALLRANGLPARYVSGYYHPENVAELGETIACESHAWIEAWIGSWWGMDPTNDTDIGLRHVVVACGRDYGDVPPVRGIYAGDADHVSTVEVKITRTA